jgi:hypothetical protein
VSLSVFQLMFVLVVVLFYIFLHWTGSDKLTHLRVEFGWVVWVIQILIFKLF